MKIKQPLQNASFALVLSLSVSLVACTKAIPSAAPLACADLVPARDAERAQAEAVYKKELDEFNLKNLQRQQGNTISRVTTLDNIRDKYIKNLESIESKYAKMCKDTGNPSP